MVSGTAFQKAKPRKPNQMDGTKKPTHFSEDGSKKPTPHVDEPKKPAVR